MRNRRVEDCRNRPARKTPERLCELDLTILND
jgi:hypothetical protein